MEKSHDELRIAAFNVFDYIDRSKTHIEFSELERLVELLFEIYSQLVKDLNKISR